MSILDSKSKYFYTEPFCNEKLNHFAIGVRGCFLKKKDNMTTDDSIMNNRLLDARSSQELIDVYLINGVKLVGKVDKFDDTSVQLSSNIEGGVTIERHSVSAVQKHSERKGSTTNVNR